MLRIVPLLVSLVFSWLTFSAPARAEDYPNRPITLIAPYAAGGGFDSVARLLAEAMGRNLGERVVVQNTTGAGGTIGARQAARATPDGYTLLLNHTGMVTAPLLIKDAGFDPLQSFEDVGLFLYSPALVVGRTSLSANTVQELVKYIRTNKEKVTIASAGVGSGTDLCAMLLEQAVGQKITHVQYRGAGPAMIDLEAGRVDLLCETPFALVPHIRAGKIKPFVLSGDETIDSLPGVPLAKDVGLNALDLGVTWYALYAPAKTPAPIIKRLSQALQAAVKDPFVLNRTKRLEMTAYKPREATPDGLKKQLKLQTERLREVFQKAGIKAR
jgi:tripartite-type tricarboxylate transporter receptor subunit TctC